MIKISNLVKKYKIGNEEIEILKGIDFEAQSGEFIAIMGRSGAGKSTFLYNISLLDYPDEGTILIDGKWLNSMSARQATDYRLKNFGFVFQEYALLPELTALENVALPLLMQGEDIDDAKEKAAVSLEQVGLSQRLKNLPSQLSGGEQQRVSIARAIAHKPKILFADEPTANLDIERSCNILNIFLELNNSGQTIIMVTHEREYAESAHRIIELSDGKILKDERLLEPKTLLCHRYGSHRNLDIKR